MFCTIYATLLPSSYASGSSSELKDSKTGSEVIVHQQMSIAKSSISDVINKKLGAFKKCYNLKPPNSPG